MGIVDSVIKIVGEQGCPRCLDDDFIPSWEAHKYPTPTSLRDRVITVLGFFHWLHQSHVKAPQIKPALIYRDLLEEDLTNIAKELSTQVFKTGVFEVFRVFKPFFHMKRDPATNVRLLRLDLVLETRRKEPLDSALTKLQGSLYNGDFPQQLREVWKRVPVKSRAKPKSALESYRYLVGQESNLNRLPLYAGKLSKINVVRAANQLIVLRLTTQIPNDATPWMTPSKRDVLIKASFSKAFAKLKG